MLERLLILLGLLIMARIWGKQFAGFMQQHFPNVVMGSEYLLLWGGLFLSALSLGLLLLYLLLQP